MAEIQILGQDPCDDEHGERGKHGKRGRRGSTGPAGPAGGLLKFSGLATVNTDGTAAVSYLPDDGGDAPVDTPLAYPLAVSRVLRNLAVNLSVSALSPPVSGATAVVQLLKNNVAVPGFAVTYDIGGGEAGIKTVTATATFALGDTFDLSVTTSGFDAAATVIVTATIGTEGVA